MPGGVAFDRRSHRLDLSQVSTHLDPSALRESKAVTSRHKERIEDSPRGPGAIQRSELYAFHVSVRREAVIGMFIGMIRYLQKLRYWPDRASWSDMEGTGIAFFHGLRGPY